MKPIMTVNEVVERYRKASVDIPIWNPPVPDFPSWDEVCKEYEMKKTMKKKPANPKPIKATIVLVHYPKDNCYYICINDESVYVCKDDGLLDKTEEQIKSYLDYEAHEMFGLYKGHGD